MERLSEPIRSGSEHSAASSTPHRGPAQRLSTTAPQTWPEWGPASIPAPWWEAATYPCAPLGSGRQDAAEHRPDEPDSKIFQIDRESFRRRKGGALTMARIFALLTALASMFLVAGAAAKY